MTDRRTKFIRRAQNGKDWVYGYTQAEIRLKERKVTEHIVGHAPTMRDATEVWLEQEQTEPV